MPYKTVMKWLGLGYEENAAEKARQEEERRREEERKKKRKNVFKPHGREQMTDEEWKALEEASK